MERDAARKKENLEKLPATPTASVLGETAKVLPPPTESADRHEIEKTIISEEDTQANQQGPSDSVGPEAQAEARLASSEARMDIPQPSIEV